MAKAFTLNQRLQFPKGLQRKFLQRVVEKLVVKHADMAVLLGVHVRTITDWKREKFSISTSAAQKLSNKSSIPIPKSVQVIDQFWYVHKGAARGGAAVYRKYGVVGGDPEKRKVAWQKWWEREGERVVRTSPIMQVRPIRKPKFSIELAEMVGILLGDGGITKYQVVVTLNSITDAQYVIYVAKLFKKLFGVDPGVHGVKGSLAVNIVVSRSQLVQFCVGKLGLKIGNKVRQQVDVPQWVKDKKSFQIACMRGLVDTDGSIFRHRYKSNGKYYSYKKLDYTSVSRPLLESAYEILKSNGIHARFYRGKSIRIDSIEDMKKYFEIFGTSNPKHLRRYRE